MEKKKGHCHVLFAHENRTMNRLILIELSGMNEMNSRERRMEEIDMYFSRTLARAID